MPGYVGTTAASSVANPPVRVSHGLISQSNYAESTTWVNGGSLWTYASSNLTTTMHVANFFTDGHLLGIRNGDILIATQQSTQSSTGVELYLGVFTDVSTSGASLSTKAFISST